MSLWDEQKKKDESQETADRHAENIRGMAGFKNLEEVASTAPKSDDEPVTRQDKKTSKRAQQEAARQQQQKQAAEDKRKDELKQAALQMLGQDVCKDFAAIPYDVWAFWMSDPNLGLTKEEQRELADTYWMLAQALQPDFLASPWFLAVIVLLRNVRYVGRRFTYLVIKKQTGQEIPPDQVEGVIMDELKKVRKPS